MKQEKKSNRGGSRPGSGRKKVALKKESYTMRLSPEEKKLIEDRRKNIDHMNKLKENGKE